MRPMANHDKPRQDFSDELHAWLKHGKDKTLGGLNAVFAEKTFAIAFLLLMALPALPIPTGGITHLTELITMLLALELIAGRKSVWLPKRWLKVDVGKALSGKAAGKLYRLHRLVRAPVAPALERRAGTARPYCPSSGSSYWRSPWRPSWRRRSRGLDTLPSLGRRHNIAGADTGRRPPAHGGHTGRRLRHRPGNRGRHGGI